MSLERQTCSLRLKLKFHNVPSGGPGDDGIRIFMDRLEHVDLGLSDMQDVVLLVEGKLTRLGLAQYAYAIYHVAVGSSGSERVVVDDAYWGMLLGDVVRVAAGSSSMKEPLVELQVVLGSPLEAGRDGSPSGSPHQHHLHQRGGGAAVGFDRLTEDAVHALRRQAPPAAPATTSAPPPTSVEVRIATLLDQPPFPKFHLVAVIVEMRLKRHPILELELCDPDDTSVAMTAVCFDASTTDQLRRALRGDGTERVELRNVLVVRKTPKDVQYQTNTHPMSLRINANTSIKVVSYVAGGVRRGAGGVGQHALNAASTAARSSVVEVTAAARRGAVGMLGGGVAQGGTSSSTVEAFNATRTLKSLRPVPHPAAAASVSASSCASGGSGSSATGGATRTMLRLTPSASAASLSSSTASSSGRMAVAPYQEPGVESIGKVDLHQRDDLLERSERKLDAMKQRIHSRGALRPSTRCILCGVDASDPAGTMELVRTMLEASSANRGQHIPEFAALLQALADRRPLYAKPTKCGAPSLSSSPPQVQRFYCKARFVDILDGTVHLVHPRCAHICEAYQRGQSSIEDVAMQKASRICALCRQGGATVRCYHPECKEEFHVVCALFSHGYVNFGKRDPLLPAPACPKHTQVKCPTLGSLEADERASRKRGRDEADTDPVLFDSGVVEAGDLRDPDDADETT